MKARSLMLGAAAVASTLALSLLAPPSSVAAVPNDTRRTVVVAGERLEMPAKIADLVETPSGWQHLTVGQLAAVGIHPGMGPQPQRPEASFTPATGGVVPMDASGCDYGNGGGAVCIYVFGTGLVVNEWDTSAKNNGAYRCTYAAYWAGSSVISTSTQTCGSIGTFWAYWKPNKFFNNGTQVCNTWVSIAGRPCETITP